MNAAPHLGHRAYAIVWIDHRQADVIHVQGEEETKLVIHSHRSVQRLHHQPPGGSADHAADTEFFARILSALEHPAGVLIAGPGQAKYALGRYLREKRPDFAAHVDHVETPESPHDTAAIGLARAHFPIGASAVTGR